jgi:outer membrane immunogenic protein
LAGQAGAVPSPLSVSGQTALGGVGGLQAGYNWQFAPAWVVGVEGDISWASLAQHSTLSPAVIGAAGGAGPGVGAGGATTSLQMSANTQWLASVRGKLGFTGWWNTMFFATGGMAWANVEYNGQGIFFNGFQDNVSFNSTRTGWVAGGGAEWMATTNILLRAEYLYYKLDGNVSGAAPYSPVFGAFGPPVFAWQNYNVQVFRIAGSYKF